MFVRVNALSIFHRTPCASSSSGVCTFWPTSSLLTATTTLLTYYPVGKQKLNLPPRSTNSNPSSDNHQTAPNTFTAIATIAFCCECHTLFLALIIRSSCFSLHFPHLLHPHSESGEHDHHHHAVPSTIRDKYKIHTITNIFLPHSHCMNSQLASLCRLLVQDSNRTQIISRILNFNSSSLIQETKH